MIEIKEIFNDVFIVDQPYHKDNRGYFSELYNKENLSELGISNSFIQDNISFSTNKNTIRGLHFQCNPNEQAKYITVLKGSIWDVFIDLRKESKTYQKFGFIELLEGQSSLLIPRGFAHGFCTLEANTLVMYKVDNKYSEEHEMGLRWNDPFFAIPWPTNNQEIFISDKDKELPFFEDLNND
tara:strand:- start:14775 stop:15320 length:546 start_codon:yes stop_codon:yes gene_type:complete